MLHSPTLQPLRVLFMKTRGTLGKHHGCVGSTQLWALAGLGPRLHLEAGGEMGYPWTGVFTEWARNVGFLIS